MVHSIAPKKGKVKNRFGGREDHLKGYEDVTLFAVHSNRYAMPAETDLPIWICRRPRLSFKQLWPQVKDFG